MIFWILLALAVVAVVLTYIYWGCDEGWLFAFMPAILAAVVSAVVVGLLMLLATLIPGDRTTSETYDLRAIGTSSSAEGRFFLGSGQIDGKRTLNYIAQEDGWSRVDQAFADDSRVFEDTDEPTVTEYSHLYWNEWVWPVAWKVGESWDFHVPAGSVLEDYTITNE